MRERRDRILRRRGEQRVVERERERERESDCSRVIITKCASHRKA